MATAGDQSVVIITQVASLITTYRYGTSHVNVAHSMSNM